MPTPSKIEYLSTSRHLRIVYEASNAFELSAEYLRVHSPSAEVRGHGNAEPKLVFGKKQVSIVGIEAVGHYALKLTFSDKHDSGIYTWDYLYELSQKKEENWHNYLQRLEREGKKRESLFIDIKELK